MDVPVGRCVIRGEDSFKTVPRVLLNSCRGENAFFRSKTWSTFMSELIRRVLDTLRKHWIELENAGALGAGVQYSNL